jgi:lysozyme
VKVSREGLVLIKSFEGFRARAEQLSDGRWAIGYGHTLSAREGATVTEADAELLLQYDLLPVVSAIETGVTAPLNQHQIDALASYALSIGAERFAASPVLALVNAGVGQPATALARAFEQDQAAACAATLRRRAAEHALFIHDPDRPLTVAHLLSQPAAPPSLAIQARLEPEAANDPAPIVPDFGSPATRVPESRAHALAVLLGEGEAAAEPVLAPEPEPEPAAVEAEAVPEPTTETETDLAQATEAVVEIAVQADPVTDAAADPGVDAEARHAEAMEAWRSSVALSMQRYSPYVHAMVGPLPGMAVAAAPMIQPASGQTAVAAPDVAVVPQAEAEPEPEPEPGPQPVTALLTAETPVSEATLLILTPPPEVDTTPPAREVWSEARRHPPVEADAEEEAALFGDDLGMADVGLQILRPELDEPAKGRFDWSETGAFLGMGGVGLVAFGASIAGFRLSSSQMAAEVFNETTIVSWVLAVIGALCVGVAAFNLYLRYSRRNDE